MPENMIAPGGYSRLLGHVELVAPSIVLIHRYEVKWTFLERAEMECAIELDFLAELVMDDELLEFARMNGRNGSLILLVNAVVHVTVHLQAT